MPLPTGTYFVRGAAYGALAGRNRHEDRSLRPKGVFCPNDEDEPVPWKFEQITGNRYKITAGGAPVAEMDGKLYAILTGGERIEEWAVTDVSYQGPDQYVIARADMQAGWVGPIDDESDHQIQVKPLIVHPTYPPRYPSFEVWIITPAKNAN